MDRRASSCCFLDHKARPSALRALLCAVSIAAAAYSPDDHQDPSTQEGSTNSRANRHVEHVKSCSAEP
jgi:hypothetical protein